MGLSNEQKEVVDASIENILVSAAAGSGKTTVLVARIIDKIIHGSYGVDDILVVTFTREAASNMCNKIEKALTTEIDNLRKSGENRELRTRLEDQLDKLPNAYIQTIDSFCSRVVKEKGFVLAGSGMDRLLEPGNTILDGNELDLILSDAANAAIEQSYADGVLNEDIEILTQMFGNGRTDESLAESLVATYKKLRSLPEYINRVTSMLEDTKKASDEGRILYLHRYIQAVLDLYSKVDENKKNQLLALIPQVQFVGKKLTEKQNDTRQKIWMEFTELYYNYASKVVEESKSGDDIRTLKAVLDIDNLSPDINPDLYTTLPAIGEDELREEFIDLFGPIAAIFLFIKPFFKDFRCPNGFGSAGLPFSLPEEYFDILRCGADGLLERQRRRVKTVSAYVDIIVRMDKLYEEFKALMHGMDFPDQEHLALKILKNDDAKIYYKNKFKEIYIDEYQDNSELQDAIIAEIENSNVFRVGDVKQSIYKFRYAEPALFLNRLNEYDTTDNGSVFRLNNNYRSDDTVLTFVNQIFFRIMSEEGAEIEYDSTHELKYPDNKIREEKLPPDVPNVTIVTRTGASNDKVCTLEGVLKEVKRYIAKGRKTGDICILTRTHRTASAIASFLNENGCAARYADEISVFNDYDIHGICNILIAAGNELRDEYLIGILISGYRISNFTLEEIAEILIYSKERGRSSEPLMNKLRAFASGKVSEADIGLQERVALFVDWFDSLRNDLIITDISELIDRIYKDTGVGASSDDPEKFLLFKQWLCTNFMRYGSDISTIASRLEKMKIKFGADTTVAREDNSDGKIRCMTYHSSKGLEFKCVIVTELYSRTNPDKTGPVKFDAVYGTVADDFDPDKVRLDRSLERLFLDEDTKLGENAEVMRLLYVALTRAQYDLSVVIPMECTKFERYQDLYRLMIKHSSGRYGRDMWLHCAGMDKAFLAAFLSFSGARELRHLIGNTFLKKNFRDIQDEVNFDAFTLDIMQNSLEGDPEADEGDAGETDSVPDAYTDAVNEVQTKKTTGIIDVYAESYDDAGMPVFAPYPYEKATEIPFKISVSQIVHHGVDGSLPINLEVHNLEHYMDVRDGITDDSASAVGTFIHRIMRFIDLDLAADDVEGQIDMLIEDGIISSKDKEKALEFSHGISSFAASDIGKKLVEADKRGEAEYEKPIVFSVPEGEDSVLVQGVIDCLFKNEDGSYTVIDYKTDRFADTVTELEMMSETLRRHSVQLGCYSAALRSAGKEVSSRYIYLLRYGMFVEV